MGRLGRFIRADKRASSHAEMPFPWYQPAHTFVDVAKKEMEERQTFRLPSIPRETKISCFCWTKSWQQTWKGFTLALCQREDLGASVEAFPFAEKKKSLAFFCFHFWKHSISSAILKRLQPLKGLFVDNKQLNWDEKELLYLLLKRKRCVVGSTRLAF